MPSRVFWLMGKTLLYIDCWCKAHNQLLSWGYLVNGTKTVPFIQESTSRIVVIPVSCPSMMKEYIINNWSWLVPTVNDFVSVSQYWSLLVLDVACISKSTQAILAEGSSWNWNHAQSPSLQMWPLSLGVTELLLGGWGKWQMDLLFYPLYIWEPSF